MECKFGCSTSHALISFGINRYIMECKWSSVVPLRFESIELIDTLWNVNSFLKSLSPGSIWINRYIMECKYSWEPDGNSNKCGN